MRILLCCAVVVLTAFPAVADGCLMADALKTGIRVTVKDGSVQTFRAKGRDVVAELSDRAKNSSFDARQTLQGVVHVVSDQRLLHDAPAFMPEGAVMVGGSEGGTMAMTYKLSGKPPTPAPGTSWTTTVRLERAEDGPSIGPQPKIKGNAVAKVVFLDKKTVDLSGCAYRIIPVETTILLAKDSRFTMGGQVMPLDEVRPGTVILSRRQIWFDDLGFAVTVKESGGGFDWVQPWGQGIIGIAAQ